jgi:HSP20 family protein
MFGTISYSEAPFYRELRRIEQHLDELFGSSTPWSGIRSLPAGSFPAVNVGSTADDVTLYVFVPGIDPQTLDISLQQNLLTISGKREVIQPAGATYYRQERPGGSFRRVVALPEDVDGDRVAATYRDGIVQITVQRREAARPRQIQIR